MAIIYKITNTFIQPNKSYIGFTTRTLEERFKEHISSGRNIRGSIYLAKSLQEYGSINHTIELLEECASDNVLERETYWIKKLNTIDEGFNIKFSFSDKNEKIYWGRESEAKNNLESGKIWNSGISPDIVTRKKISNTKKEKFILGLYEKSYGHPHTEETKTNLSLLIKNQYSNGRKNSQALLYDVLVENGDIIKKIDKIEIQTKFNLSEKQWRTLCKWSRDNSDNIRYHPKFKIMLVKVGKIYND